MVAETREHLQHTVSEFERVCYSMGLKINVGKSKMLMIKKDQMVSCEKVRVNGEELQEELKGETGEEWRLRFSKCVVGGLIELFMVCE